MSTNQMLNTKMLEALQSANPVTITSTAGVLTLTRESNSFIANGDEAISAIGGGEDVTQGIYIITWSSERTLKYNQAVLQLIGKVDRNTAVGDVGVYQLNNGVVTELFYSPGSGKAASATTADTATIAQSCSGNAATATKLATKRTLSFTGDATGALSFDGSADESAALTLASSGVTAGTYQSVTVDEKGRVIAGTNPTSLDVDVTGNAATATKLKTARTINGVAFDGSTNVIVTAAANGGNSDTCGGYAPAISATASAIAVRDANGALAGNITGNAATATVATEATMADSVAWNNITGKPSTFTPPVATVSTLGGIKQGAGLSIAADGAASVSNTIPSGGIIMWSGTVANIPGGWALCDGTNGTPNLRDRFIVGAGSSYVVGATGGEATHTLTQAELPVVSSGSIPIKSSLAGTYGSKTGLYIFPDDVTLRYGYLEYANWQSLPVAPSGGGAAHENRPPYYALAFIMKL